MHFTSFLCPKLINLVMKKILYPVAIAIAGWCCAPLSAQTVSTITTSSSKIDDAMAMDTNGNLYGSNYEGKRVYKRAVDGTESILLSGLGNPNGILMDPSGFFYLCDPTANTIYKVNLDGTKTAFVTSLSKPSDLARIPGTDTLLVTTYINNSVWKVAPDGSSELYLTHPAFNGIFSICFGENQDLYLANFNDTKIFKVTPDKEISLLAQLPITGSIGFIIYREGYIYSTAFSANKIYKTDLLGNSTLWLGSSLGSTDGDAAVAKFNRPNGILLSSTKDTMYISDFGTKRVRMITNLDGTSSQNNIETPQRNLSIQPNPTTSESFAAIDLAIPMDLHLSLCDASGGLVRIIFSGERLEQGQHNIRIFDRELPPGVYFLKMEWGDGTVEVRKLIQLQE